MNEEQANIICDLLEAATSSNWIAIRSDILSQGWEPAQVVDAVETLSELADVEPCICDEDF